MNRSASARDRRQLRLARAILRDYELGRVSLRKLVSNLDALWTEFSLDEAWTNRYREEWFSLETALALMSDDAQPREWDPSLERAVGDAVLALEDLLAQYPVDDDGDED